MNQKANRCKVKCPLAGTCDNGVFIVDTYRAHAEAFTQIKEKRGTGITPTAQALFYALLEYANKNEWPESFEIRKDRLTSLACIGRSTEHKARQELEEAGVVVYEEHPGNKSGTYRLTVVK